MGVDEFLEVLAKDDILLLGVLLEVKMLVEVVTLALSVVNVTQADGVMVDIVLIEALDIGESVILVSLLEEAIIGIIYQYIIKVMTNVTDVINKRLN